MASRTCGCKIRSNHQHSTTSTDRCRHNYKVFVSIQYIYLFILLKHGPVNYLYFGLICPMDLVPKVRGFYGFDQSKQAILFQSFFYLNCLNFEPLTCCSVRPVEPEMELSGFSSFLENCMV